MSSPAEHKEENKLIHETTMTKKDYDKNHRFSKKSRALGKLIHEFETMCDGVDLIYSVKDKELKLTIDDKILKNLSKEDFMESIYVAKYIEDDHKD